MVKKITPWREIEFQLLVKYYTLGFSAVGLGDGHKKVSNFSDCGLGAKSMGQRAKSIGHRAWSKEHRAWSKEQRAIDCRLTPRLNALRQVKCAML